MNRLKLRYLYILIAFLQLNQAFAEEPDQFYSTWRLLDHVQREQFVAGYLKGLSDSRARTTAALDYVRHNPNDSASAKKIIDELFGKMDGSATELARGIEQFYSDGDNRGAPLSKALAEARAAAAEKE